MRAARLIVPALLVGAAIACTPSENSLTPDPTETGVPDDAPIADAGPDQQVAPLMDVLLDGTASYDPKDRDPLTFEWTIISKPEGSTVELSGANTDQPTFMADLAGDYVIGLTVENIDGVRSEVDEVVVTATPLDGFYVQLSWDQAVDLDLHLLNTGADLWDDTNDCYFGNTNPDWGSWGDTMDDPSLDADAISGYGPETITIDAPVAGDYRVNVHYYGMDGMSSCYGSCPPTTATVAVYMDGVLTHTWSRTMNDAEQVWDVATIHWPGGNVTEHDQMGTSAP